MMSAKIFVEKKEANRIKNERMNERTNHIHNIDSPFMGTRSPTVILSAQKREREKKVRSCECLCARDQSRDNRVTHTKYIEKDYCCLEKCNVQIDRRFQ